MVDFETRTLIKNEKTLIQKGQPVNGYVLPDKTITLSDIEYLYADYETSFPDRQTESVFYAKPEEKLTLTDIVYGKNRSETQEQLEQTLLEGILNQSLIYPDNTKWFWQSSEHENLIIPRWLFTQECHRKIAYRPQPLKENMLWDKNLVGKRLRKSLNTGRQPDMSILSFKDCLLMIKEELMEHEHHPHISDTNMQSLLSEYMKNIKNNDMKAGTGQYVSCIKNAKTAACKIRAINSLLENAPYLSKTCILPEWQKIHTDFVDRRTLLFIETFIPGARPVQISGTLTDYTEDYIRENLTVITDYVMDKKRKD